MEECWGGDDVVFDDDSLLDVVEKPCDSLTDGFAASEVVGAEEGF